MRFEEFRSCFRALVDVFRTQRSLTEVLDVEEGLHVWAAELQTLAALLDKGDLVVALEVHHLIDIGVWLQSPPIEDD